jgi:hypothetical protein
MADHLPVALQPRAERAWAGREAPEPRGPPQAHARTLAGPCSALLDARGGASPPPTPSEPNDDWDGWEDCSHLLLAPADNPAAVAVCPNPAATSAAPIATLPMPIPLGRPANVADRCAAASWACAGRIAPLLGCARLAAHFALPAAVVHGVAAGSAYASTCLPAHSSPPILPFPLSCLPPSLPQPQPGRLALPGHH